MRLSGEPVVGLPARSVGPIVFIALGCCLLIVVFDPVARRTFATGVTVGLAERYGWLIET